MNLDTDGFYSWGVRDRMGYRGAGGVTDRSGRAVELLFAALRDLSPGATGVIRVVRLDRHARNPSYLPGQIVFRVDTDKATRVFVEDATPTGERN